MENLPSTYENAKTKFIDVNGIQIAYRTIGKQSPIPLVCLQHFTGNMNGWDPLVINGLSKNRQVRDPNWAPGFTEQTFLAQMEAIVGWGEVPDSSTPLLTKIKHPVLIINGSNDHMFASANSYVMFRQLENAKLSLYPDSAHGSFFQYPELFNNEAIYFLDNEI